jgi:phenylacetate-CoA ligase
LKFIPELQQLHQKSIDEVRSYQLKKLQHIVTSAYETVPFYRNEWDSIGLKPRDIQRLEDIKSIPILTKDKLRSNTDEFLANGVNKQDLIISLTGGTTDSPIQICYDHERLLYKRAEMMFFRGWWHWNLGDKVAYLWGAPQDIPEINNIKWKVKNALFERNLFLYSSLLDDDIMRVHIDKINSFQPDIIQAYPSPLYILAKYILNNGIKVHSPKSVTLTAEPCDDHQRKTIQNAFNAPVFTFYGTREAGYVGVECSAHNGYHMNCSSLYSEIIQDNTDVQSGEIGSIILTDLINTKMPFIRYQIGDMGIYDDEPCSCGSVLPKMKFFAGRETDVFVTPDGKYIPGVSLTGRIIKDCKGIKAMQFIQDEPDKLLVKIVKGPEFSNHDIELLDAKIYDFFQQNMHITKVFVDNIPKAKSGKTRVCICNVPKNI